MNNLNMVNSNLEWRVGAKIVAVVDLICALISLLYALLVVFVASASTQAISNSDIAVPEKAVVIASDLALSTANLWTAAQLIKATELGRDANDAYKCCMSWLVVRIATTVLFFIASLNMELYIWMAMNLLISFSIFYIVCRFMQELKTIVVPTSHQMKQSQNV